MANINKIKKDCIADKDKKI